MRADEGAESTLQIVGDGGVELAARQDLAQRRRVARLRHERLPDLGPVKVDQGFDDVDRHPAQHVLVIANRPGQLHGQTEGIVGGRTEDVVPEAVGREGRLAAHPSAHRRHVRRHPFGREHGGRRHHVRCYFLEPSRTGVPAATADA